MHKDIEYQKDGVKKFAQERFKSELEAVGWSVVNQGKDASEQPEPTKARGRPKKQNKED